MCGMCGDRPNYCVGCGRFRPLDPYLLICGECSEDWWRLRTRRSPGQMPTPEEVAYDRGASDGARQVAV